MPQQRKAQSKAQKDTIGRVMHEFKHGELKSSQGTKVKNPKQAIAIGLHEAGASRDESDERNEANLRRTKARERQAATASAGGSDGIRDSRVKLYEEAKRRQISGRSKMSKTDLQRALGG
jgi:uncharacterized protein DUF6496